MRPLVKRWRGLGIRSVIYLDDGILGDKSYDQLNKNISLVVRDLSSEGLTINLEKSQLSPTKKCQWLGFIIDSNAFKFTVSEKKISAIKRLLTSTVTAKLSSAREMSRIAGMIISMKPAIGSVAQILTRHMFFFISEKPSWDRKYELNSAVKYSIDSFIPLLKNEKVLWQFQIILPGHPGD